MELQWEAEPKAPRAKRISPEKWEEHHKELLKLYIEEDLTLDDVMERMGAGYGFWPSLRQYKYQLFDKWGLRKYKVTGKAPIKFGLGHHLLQSSCSFASILALSSQRHKVLWKPKNRSARRHLTSPTQSMSFLPPGNGKGARTSKSAPKGLHEITPEKHRNNAGILHGDLGQVMEVDEEKISQFGCGPCSVLSSLNDRYSNYGCFEEKNEPGLHPGPPTDLSSLGNNSGDNSEHSASTSPSSYGTIAPAKLFATANQLPGLSHQTGQKESNSPKTATIRKENISSNPLKDTDSAWMTQKENREGLKEDATGCLLTIGDCKLSDFDLWALANFKGDKAPANENESPMFDAPLNPFEIWALSTLPKVYFSLLVSNVTKRPLNKFSSDEVINLKRLADFLFCHGQGYRGKAFDFYATLLRLLETNDGPGWMISLIRVACVRSAETIRHAEIIELLLRKSSDDSEVESIMIRSQLLYTYTQLGLTYEPTTRAQSRVVLTWHQANVKPIRIDEPDHHSVDLMTYFHLTRNFDLKGLVDGKCTRGLTDLQIKNMKELVLQREFGPFKMEQGDRQLEIVRSCIRWCTEEFATPPAEPPVLQDKTPQETFSFIFTSILGRFNWVYGGETKSLAITTAWMTQSDKLLGISATELLAVLHCMTAIFPVSNIHQLEDIQDMQSTLLFRVRSLLGQTDENLIKIFLAAFCHLTLHGISLTTHTNSIGRPKFFQPPVHLNQETDNSSPELSTKTLSPSLHSSDKISFCGVSFRNGLKRKSGSRSSRSRPDNAFDWPDWSDGTWPLMDTFSDQFACTVSLSEHE